MYVRDWDKRAAVPATATQFTQHQLARFRALRAAGRQGFGDLMVATAVEQTAPTAFPSSGGGGGDTGLEPTFLEKWGVPGAAALGGMALGLAMAKALSKKR